MDAANVMCAHPAQGDAGSEASTAGFTESEVAGHAIIREEEGRNHGPAAPRASSERDAGDPLEMRRGDPAADAADFASVTAAAAAPTPEGTPEGLAAPRVQRLSARQLRELPRPPALLGVKSKRRPVLSLQSLMADNFLPEAQAPSLLPKTAAAMTGSTLLLGLAARASVAGLSAEEAAQLCAELAAPDAGDEGLWSCWRYEGLKVKCLSAAPEEQLAKLAEDTPHVISLQLDLLQTCVGAIQVLRDFKGILIVVESPSCVEAVNSGLLETLGITTRWALREPFAGPHNHDLRRLVAAQ